VAFVLSLPLLPILVFHASTPTAVVALGIYGASVTLLYGTSAAYHLLTRSQRSQWIMRRLDHAMIFVQIAGTYTPVCLLALPAIWGWPLLGTVWTAALVGMAIKLSAKANLMRYSNVLYLAVAWVAILALPALIRHLDGFELAMLGGGGVLYTVGALLFAARLPRLWPPVFGFHEVWHAFTMLAGLAHLGMVWSIAFGQWWPIGGLGAG
jgi:hemolysin III